MTIKTKIGDLGGGADQGFTPRADVPRSSVQAAVEYVAGVAGAPVDLATDVTGDLPFANFVQAASAGFVGATVAGDYAHRTYAQTRADLDLEAGTDFYSIAAADAAFAAISHTHAAGDVTSGTFADARIAETNVTQHQAALALAASQTTSGTFADARIAETNVTQHQAALALAASQTTSGTFADARIAETNVTQHQAAIDHDALTNFVSDEHVAHSGVTITAGTGLTGGGTIAASRTLDLDINGLTDAGAFVSGDKLAIYDASVPGIRKIDYDDLPGGRTELISGPTTISSVATLDFTFTPASYRYVYLHLDNVLPASDGVDLWVRTSTNGGSTYDTSGYVYGSFCARNGSSSGGGSVSAGQIVLNADGIGNAAGEGISGVIKIHNPSASAFTRVTATDLTWITDSPANEMYTGHAGGHRASAADVDAVRIMFSSGNLASGTVSFYGVR